MEETIEEVARQYATDMGGDFYQGLYNAFKKGAKWQQERSYSEEEVITLIDWYLNIFLDDALGLNGRKAEKKVEHLKGNGLTKEVLDYWFEQFKKNNKK